MQEGKPWQNYLRGTRHPRGGGVMGRGEILTSKRGKNTSREALVMLSKGKKLAEGRRPC